MTMHKTLGTALMTLGLALFLAAAALVAANLREEQRAGESAQSALESLTQVIPSKPSTEVPGIDSLVPGETVPEDEIEYPDYVLNPDMPMPEHMVYGIAYIGQLEIPDLELTLPIISKTTGSNLQIAPCRFSGSAYSEDMVLGAHNYEFHFGKIGDLRYGQEVTFTDMDGNVFRYQVSNIEILQPNDVEELCSGEWPLTLYTCTIGGRTRIVVRCEYIPEDV